MLSYLLQGQQFDLKPSAQQPLNLEIPALKNPEFWYQRLRQKDAEISDLKFRITELSATIDGFEQLVKNKSALTEQLELKIRHLQKEIEYCDSRNKSLERSNQLKESIVAQMRDQNKSVTKKMKSQIDEAVGQRLKLMQEENDTLTHQMAEIALISAKKDKIIEQLEFDLK